MGASRNYILIKVQQLIHLLRMHHGGANLGFLRQDSAAIESLSNQTYCHPLLAASSIATMIPNISA